MKVFTGILYERKLQSIFHYLKNFLRKMVFQPEFEYEQVSLGSIPAVHTADVRISSFCP
jgi:hypothetical protein